VAPAAEPAGAQKLKNLLKFEIQKALEEAVVEEKFLVWAALAEGA
jgi:hypothetical protein